MGRLEGGWQRAVEDAATRERYTLRERRSGNEARVVERCRRPSGHYISRSSGPCQRHALLASDGAGGKSWHRRQIRRHFCGHESFVCRLSEMEGAGAPRARAGRVAATAVDSAGHAAGGNGVLHQEAVNLLPQQRRYSREIFSSGNVNEKTEPLPNWLTTPIVPPWASMITFAIARPMPVPG